MTVNVADGHPVGPRSAMGLSAFYYALVLVVCGMLGANVVNSQVDTALGYLHTDFGPIRKREPVQHTTRVRTLAIGIALMLGLSLVMGTLVEVATVGILDMDASHLGLLWLYSVATIAVVGIGSLALFAAFGTPGMLLATIVFVAMAVPSSGATVPVQALPGFFRALAEFEPLRQITEGLRSLLYYGAQADAGLTRAWASMGVALVAALIFGFTVTRLYDRKGLHRIPTPTPKPAPRSPPRPLSPRSPPRPPPRPRPETASRRGTSAPPARTTDRAPRPHARAGRGCYRRRTSAVIAARSASERATGTLGQSSSYSVWIRKTSSAKERTTAPVTVPPSAWSRNRSQASTAPSQSSSNSDSAQIASTARSREVRWPRPQSSPSS